MHVIGNSLTVRTRAGRQVCRISDDQFSALSNGRADSACAGVRLSLRRDRAGQCPSGKRQRGRAGGADRRPGPGAADDRRPLGLRVLSAAR